MAEHARSNGHQWCDTELYMVFDRCCGPERMRNGFYGTKDECLEHVQHFKGWEHRKILIRVDAIAGFKLQATA